MDLITKTPGLQHIAEQIFSNLDKKSIWQCQKVNNDWWNILVKPRFWFDRMKPNTKLSQEHQKEWMKFCEKLSKLHLTKDMTQPLNYIYGQLEDSVTLTETYLLAVMSIGDLECSHSSEIRGLSSTKSSSEMLQNLLYFMYKKTHVAFFVFHFVQLYFFSYECPGLCRHRPGHL